MTYLELLKLLKAERSHVDERIAKHLRLMILRHGARKSTAQALKMVAR